MQFYFDMDGTIADFYGVENWKEYLDKEDTRPYELAKPMVKFNVLARQLNALQRKGHTINIISWGSKTGSTTFLEKVAQAKKKWLKKHLPSVNWNTIAIVAYGVSKVSIGKATNILFDDSDLIRAEWGENAHLPSEITKILHAYNSK